MLRKSLIYHWAIFDCISNVEEASPLHLYSLPIFEVQLLQLSHAPNRSCGRFSEGMGKLNWIIHKNRVSHEFWNDLVHLWILKSFNFLFYFWMNFKLSLNSIKTSIIVTHLTQFIKSIVMISFDLINSVLIPFCSNARRE